MGAGEGGGEGIKLQPSSKLILGASVVSNEIGPALSFACTSGILGISSLSEVAIRVSEDEAESEGEMVMTVPDPETEAEQETPSAVGSSEIEPVVKVKRG
jgi:hypothetical protein